MLLVQCQYVFFCTGKFAFLTYRLPNSFISVVILPSFVAFASWFLVYLSASLHNADHSFPSPPFFSPAIISIPFLAVQFSAFALSNLDIIFSFVDIFIVLYFVGMLCCLWLCSLCESYHWMTSSFQTWSDTGFMQIICKSVCQPVVCLPLFRHAFHLASSVFLAWQLADNKGRAELCISPSEALLCPSLFIPHSSYCQHPQSAVSYLDTCSYEFFCSGFIIAVISSIIQNVSLVSFS